MNHHEIRLKTIDSFLKNPNVPEYYKSKLKREKLKVIVMAKLEEAYEWDNKRRR